MVFHALMFEGGSGEPKADQGFQISPEGPGECKCIELIAII